MIIRPGGSAGEQVTYAGGSFADDDDGFTIYQAGGASPLGSFLVSAGSEYAAEIRPDGTGRAWFAGMDVIAQHGLGRAWYLRDSESGAVWSAFFSPVCEKADDYAVRFLPGQVCVTCLKGKIRCELTVATVPGQPCEIWRVRLENCSARDRTVSFTTYLEPAIASSIETKFVEQDRVILLRRPLESIEVDRTDGAAQDLVLMHSSTLPASNVQTSRVVFVGEGRTLRNPRQLEPPFEPNVDGVKNGAIASFTVETDIPIEGVAEFGFCFGLASGAERAVRLARAFGSYASIDQAVRRSLDSWKEILSTSRCRSSDRSFDALVNTWLPYEAFAGWIRERCGPRKLDPSRVADLLRAGYALAGGAPGLVRDCIVNFAAGMTVLDRYSHADGSAVSIPLDELVWLPAAAARYVAETGDASLLATVIPIQQGCTVTLREQCERILRMCAADSGRECITARAVAREAAREWPLLTAVSAETSEALKALLAEDQTVPEASETEMPPLLLHLQKLCRTLEDRAAARTLAENTVFGGTRPTETGTALIAYRAVVDDLLGITATNAGLRVKPRLPDSWHQFEVVRRYRGDTYSIVVRRALGPGCSSSIVVDGEPVLGNTLPYFGDGGVHRVEVTVL